MTSSTPVREKLLDAAGAEFADRGYPGASVRAICARAGVNLGAVSYHFGGKRQLYRAVLRRAAERLAQGLEALPSSAASPRERAARILEVLDTHASAVRLLLRDIADGGEAAMEALAPLLRLGLEMHLSSGDHDDPLPTEARLGFAARITPILGAALLWPLLRAGLGFTAEDRTRLFERLLAP